MSFAVKYIHSPLAHSAYGNSVGGALSTAAGYSEDDLGDGTVERSWRSGASATDHNITIDLGAAGGWDTVAVFDVKATDGTAPTAVEIDFGSSMSTFPGVDEELTMNADGDGWLTPVETITRYVNIHVAFGSAKILRIGEIYFGTLATLTRAYAERRDRHDWHGLENFTPAGTRSIARLAGRSRILSLSWAELLESERDELAALWSNTNGGATPIVLIPNVDAPTDVLHGTIPQTWEESIDVLRSGIGFDFVQSGRAA